jgi:hypothetical protein
MNATVDNRPLKPPDLKQNNLIIHYEYYKILFFGNCQPSTKDKPVFLQKTEDSVARSEGCYPKNI